MLQRWKRLPFWPEKTIFHREVIPTGVQRSLWLRQMSELLEPSDVVFVDPDNGIGAATKLHVTVEEVEALGRNKRPVIMIKFPHRNAKYPEQLDELHQLFNGRPITTVMTSVWVKQPRATWFSIINSTELMNVAAQEFVERFNSIQHAKAEVCISNS